jgi:hypothetical protein
LRIIIYLLGIQMTDACITAKFVSGAQARLKLDQLAASLK